MTDTWFSAMLRFVVLVDGIGATRRFRSLVLLTAADWGEANQKALTLGREMERDYAGGTGEQIRWRLEGIDTIDEIGGEVSDGREVYAEPVELRPGEFIPFEAEFRPAETEPGQSGV